jgi:pimeloyl-ACP methyl ester carboxylesterase
MKLLLSLVLVGSASVLGQDRDVIEPVEKPQTITCPRLVEASLYTRVAEARTRFGVSGAGFSVAVIDTGIRHTHADFRGKTIIRKDFVFNFDNYAWDFNGHGSHVSGIVAANGTHQGMAPDVNLVALRVLDENGSGSFRTVVKALTWVLANKDKYNITAVNLSLGNGYNFRSSYGIDDDIRLLIAQLRQEKVAVIVAAGNSYYYSQREGMSYPANVPECISVGALFDADIGPVKYASGAEAYLTKEGFITPFSQRLSEDYGFVRTDIFAPGESIISTGIDSDVASATMRGTSMAAPMVTGAVVLLQEYYKKLHGELPPVRILEEALRSGRHIIDGDDEQDNVTNTMKEFRGLDVVSAMEAIEVASLDPVRTMTIAGKIHLNFRIADRDKLALTLTFAFPGIPDNRLISLDVGKRKIFFDMYDNGKVDIIKGKATNKDGICKLSLLLKKDSLRNTWEEEGLVNDDVSGIDTQIKVHMSIDGLDYEGFLPVHYEARKDKSGKAMTLKTYQKG